MLRISSRTIAGFVAVLVLEATSRADVITTTRDPHDQPDVIKQLAHDPRVDAFRREVNLVRQRILHWKERDFVEVLGQPVQPSQLDDALLTVEARVLAFSGAGSLDPQARNDHAEAYPVANIGHVVVYFGHDGQEPVHALFYLKTDQDFHKLDRADQLKQRLNWEQVRFARMNHEIDRRWRKTVGWEIDLNAEKARSNGLGSGDFVLKLQAIEQWGKERGYTLNHRPPKGDKGPTWVWLQGEVPMATASHDRGLKGNQAKPSHFEFNRSDGTLLRDETGWPSQEMVRWYRPGGEKMAYIETGNLQDASWRPDEWTWYDQEGDFLRLEADSNHDGIPDVQGFSDLADQQHFVPLAVNRSWAVNPDLIPAQVRNPDQPDRRVVLRKIPE